MLAKTREIDLRRLSRNAHRNDRTRVLMRPVDARPPPTCEVAFVTAYDTVRTVTRAHPDPGLAVFAIDQDGVACSATFRAKTDRTQTAVVGRHTGADVFLAEDSAVSLRHLAIVMHPHQAGERLRFHLIDLRTELGLRDERGIPVEHLIADGPLFIQVGGYAVLVFPTADERITWPDDPLEAFSKLPERTYDVEGSGRPRRPAHRRSPMDTAVQIIRGPRFADHDASERDTPVGQLRVHSAVGETAFIVGASAARGGLLLGRYDRCDSSGTSVLDDHRISRVHVLLLSIDERVVAIDMASTNGLWHATTEIRARRLAFGDRLELAKEVAWITWDPVH